MITDEKITESTIEYFDLKEPSMYQIVMHNDDYTTMDFVVLVLIKIFHKTMEDATALMKEIHYKGKTIIGVYTQDIAETKVDMVHHISQEHHFPLLCTIEPLD